MTFSPLFERRWLKAILYVFFQVRRCAARDSDFSTDRAQSVDRKDGLKKSDAVQNVVRFCGTLTTRTCRDLFWDP